MKVMLRDPRAPFVLKPEREMLIHDDAYRVINEMVAKDFDLFVRRAATLEREIDDKLADIDKALTDTDVTDSEKMTDLYLQKVRQESRRRTAVELESEAMEALVKRATAVLEEIHKKKMDARLAHWATTCRHYGCCKQPRPSPKTSGHKVRRRTFVFCGEHAGDKNLIPKREYNQLRNNVMLRVLDA